MEKMHEYLCASHILTQTKIIELKEILKNGTNKIFDESISREKIEQEIKYLEEMHYCDECPNREKCLNYMKEKKKCQL